MKYRHRLNICAFILVVLPTGCSQGPTPRVQFVAPPQDPFPIEIIQLHGSSKKLGSQHGQQLGSTIQSLHTQYLGKWFANAAQRFVAVAAARGFENHLLPEHRTEMHALASSSGIDPNQMMLAQCFLDLSPMTACSTVAFPAEASPDGVARMGRNLDFPSFNLADKQSLVFVFRPEGRYSFAAVGWPGLIGVLSGMNEHGLTLANMEVTRKGSIPVAMPYTLLYRTILEQCRDVDEAIALLERSKRQTPNNLMLMDARGNRAVVEIRPESVSVRRGQPEQALMSTNHQRDQDAQSSGRCWRYDLLGEMSRDQFGSIRSDGLQKMMAAVAQNDFTLQSMVFEPSTRVMYLAIGRNAPNTSTFYRLDLKPLFEKPLTTAGL